MPEILTAPSPRVQASSKRLSGDHQASQLGCQVTLAQNTIVKDGETSGREDPRMHLTQRAL